MRFWFVLRLGNKRAFGWEQSIEASDIENETWLCTDNNSAIK